MAKEDPYHSVRLKPDVWWELEEYRRGLEMTRFAETRDPRRVSASDAVEELLRQPGVKQALGMIRARAQAFGARL